MERFGENWNRQIGETVAAQRFQVMLVFPKTRFPNLSMSWNFTFFEKFAFRRALSASKYRRGFKAFVGVNRAKN